MHPVSKKASRSILATVLLISAGLHVAALFVFGIVTVATNVFREEIAFDVVAPLEAPEQPPEVIPVDLKQRNQSSTPPRPNPIVVDQVVDVDLPALDIDLNVANTSSYGRGGGGFGGNGLGGTGSKMREMATVNIKFFGAEAGGNRIAILLDHTGSGRHVFAETRDELFDTLKTMKKDPSAEVALVYFGGATAGHVVGNIKVDPTKKDYWGPHRSKRIKWMPIGSEALKKAKKELEEVDPSDKSLQVNTKQFYSTKDGVYFVLGTQFWGALNAAFELKPAPDTVFFMIEPKVAFPSVEKVKQSYAWFEKYGKDKPKDTKVHFIIGHSEKSFKGKTDPLELMVNLVNGGDLKRKEIDDLITFTRK